MCMLRKTGEAYGILGQGILIHFVENKEEIYFHSCQKKEFDLITNNRWFLKKKESAICYFCMKNNMENAKKALTFGAKRNKLNERVEKGNVFLMRK